MDRFERLLERLFDGPPVEEAPAWKAPLSDRAVRLVQLQTAQAALYARTGQVPTTYAIWQEAGL